MLPDARLLVLRLLVFELGARTGQTDEQDA